MRDISGQSNQANLTRALQLADFVVFGDQNTHRLSCKKDASVSLQAIYSMGTDEAVSILDNWWHNYSGQARYLQINMPDNAIGSRRYEGYFFLENLELPLDASEAGPVQMTASLQVNGQL